MRFRPLRALAFGLGLAFAGCGVFVPGDWEEGLPKLSEKWPAGTRVLLVVPGSEAPKQNQRPRAAAQVLREWARALTEAGFAPVAAGEAAKEGEDVLKLAKERKCAYAFVATVDAWAYSEEGFFTKSPRDDVALSVTVWDVERSCVATRASVRVASSWRIFDEYVRKELVRERGE